MRLYKNKYLSVTSIISLREPFDEKSFNDWCLKTGTDNALVSSTSRILGEKVSNYLDDHYRGFKGLSSPPVDKLEEDLVGGMEDFLKEWEIIETEKYVECRQLNYAGKLDGIIKNKSTNEVLLVDWKTFGAWKDKPYKRESNKIKHTRWQLTLYNYAMSWEDRGRMAVVVFKNDGAFEIERVKFDEEMMKWTRENQDKILQCINEETKSTNKNKSA